MSEMWSPIPGTNEVGLCPLVFSFVTNGSSDPDATLIRGKKVSTITYSSTGKWIVTLTAGFYQIVGATAHVNAPSTGADASFARVYFPDEAADPLVLHVFHQSEDSDTPAAPGAATRITVVLWVKTSVGG